MQIAAWSVLVYALIVAGGGVFGFVRAHSVASLVASLSFALVLLACVPGLFRAKRPALVISLVLILVLDAFFTYRFSQSQAWMPSGMMMLLSLVTLAVIVYGIRKTSKPS